MKYSKDKEIVPYFSVNQFLDNRDSQKPDHTQLVNMVLLAIKLCELRKVLGRMDITSGFRGNAWNVKVGGDYTSYHLDAKAVDFERKNDKGMEDWGDWTPEELFAVANYIGFGNIGVYLNQVTKAILWVHIDIGKPWPDGYNGWKHYSDTMSCRIIWRK